VRQLAREFGVELSAVGASGPHGRILKEDVQVYVKAMMQKAKEAPPLLPAQPVARASRRFRSWTSAASAKSKKCR
jgi:pyruvate/2-oxoglutarate dehydrogenase complex dihydrolipoamide acyltransferase (E2) component